MSSKILSLPAALAWILGSTFLITGSGYSIFKATQGKFLVSSKKSFAIKKIIQTGLHRDILKTDYLAEILGLSQDHPTVIFAFDARIAEKKLLAMPMIKEANVSTIKPDRVYVDYTMREPIAMVYDYENVAVDEEGFLFPFSPFYSPKELPEFYFGLPPLEGEESCFARPLQGEAFLLATQVLKSLKAVALEEKFFLKRIDVSHAFERSFGRQELVIDVANEVFGLSEASDTQFLHHLRLSPKDYAKQLGNYLILHKELTAQKGEYVRERMIDLRMEGIALIDKGAKE